ncbi:hypothetical protein EOD42_24565 [Rhodovarius crocodyli]|uniref:DNA polymerase Y family protein n=1 Tax=Rhodovarius crocodyli TaxID=1979269 RepID=A0A437LX39_9PROT|nr:hypothetical protein [Rhodovarius crocodyli]RVT89939.1 hypothetical protein EOD42_24565 [Rhodovarius crocodyli]
MRDLFAAPVVTARHLVLLVPDAARWAPWARRFSPLVGVVAEDALAMEVTGVTHLSGGEESFLAEVKQGFSRAGQEVPALLGGAWPALLALLRGGWRDRVLNPEQQAAAWPTLHPRTLPLPKRDIVTLHRVGLRQLGQIRQQHRAVVTYRMLDGLLKVLDQVAGDAPAPITPVREPPTRSVSENYTAPLITRPALDAALDRLLGKLCAHLAEAGLGARRMVLTGWRMAGSWQEVAAGSGQASSQPAKWAMLFREPLGRLRPELGFERFTLATGHVDEMRASQPGLDASTPPEVLGRLLDRLAQRVELWRLQPRQSFWPERSTRRIPAHEAVAEEWLTPVPRPVRMLRRPRELRVLPDEEGVLATLELDGRTHRILHAWGPERLLPEWWDNPKQARPRDYYALQLAEGPRWWVCRTGAEGDADPRWYLHGLMG